MDQKPRRSMDMGPRRGMDGMGGPRPVSQPTPVAALPVAKPAAPAVPVRAQAPQVKVKRPAASAAPAQAVAHSVSAAAPVPPSAPTVAAAPKVSSGRGRRILKAVLQGLAWLLVILAVAAVLIELYVRYYQ